MVLNKLISTAARLDKLGFFVLADSIEALLSRAGPKTQEELKGLNWMRAYQLDDETADDIELPKRIKERHQDEEEKTQLLTDLGNQLAHILDAHLINKAAQTDRMVMLSRPDLSIVLAVGDGIKTKLEALVLHDGVQSKETFQLDLAKGPIGVEFYNQILNRILGLLDRE